eukprot:scaffold108310_cov24-Phaeocystis_antarctica.AAC.1
MCQRLQPHVPEAAIPRARGCNPMHPTCNPTQPRDRRCRTGARLGHGDATGRPPPLRRRLCAARLRRRRAAALRRAVRTSALKRDT